MGTSSSSSSSYSSSSSSSGFFCFYPECNGTACQYFSDWTLYNVSPTLVTDEKLYVLFNYFTTGGIQQIEIYNDPNYYNLIGIGQASSAGSITIIERNDSGISGVVVWDGTPVDYSKTATLYCEDVSSSSSTSSIDSSSSSSQSISSNSSSSSNCCTSPYCDGESKNEFSSWTFSGMNANNSNNCKLYVGLEYNAGIQQVRIYKDVLLTQLVSIGQNNSSPITLSSVNSSGLSGSVSWTGTPVEYPNTLVLDCEIFSSSSTSSSSSIDSSSSSSIDSSSSSLSSSSTSSSSSVDSSSSSSSSSFGESSSSTLSSSSDSSKSSSSSTSSSSIDSSSSSSESFGNVSSSSSSSIEIWNRVKPLILALVANSNGSIQNRLSQTIQINTTEYLIGSVYCYLYGNYGSTPNFTVYLGIYDCTDDGKPNNLISVKTLSSSQIVGEKWYEFAFDITGTTPSNQYLSFVMWQQNGNENNYALWGYSYSAANSISKAFISQDASTWTEQENVVRAIRVTDYFDIYDFVDKSIKTPPAKIQEIITSLVGGTEDGTIYNPSSGEVSVNYPNLLVSMIADSSGSMGWNDRFGSRTEFIQQFVNRIKDYYPANVLFDFLKFGAVRCDTSDVGSEQGESLKINLDLNEPTRTTYLFDISGATVSENAVYTHNDGTYTVVNGINNGVLLETKSNTIPLDAGTLVLQSGTGDSSIVFTAYRKISTQEDSFIACGFKNLENGHTYNVGQIIIDNNIICTASSNNWNLFYPINYESPSIVESYNGPKNTLSTDIKASSSLITRKLFRSDIITSIPVTEPLDKEESIVVLQNVTGLTIGESIDIIDGTHSNTNRSISSIDNLSVTFSPSSTYDIWEQNRRNSVVQPASLTPLRLSAYTTAMLSVRDVEATEGKYITFYLQTSDGYTIEWDFLPHKQWYTYNLYWIDETANIPFTLKDSFENPFPDRTKIRLSVDSPPPKVQNAIAATTLSNVAFAGDYKIYVESLSGFTAGMTIDVVDNDNHIQTLYIYQTGEDNNGYYLEFYEPLLYEFDPINGAKIVEEIEEEGELNHQDAVPFSLSMVDTTPIYRNKSLDQDLLEPYDPIPVDPSTAYDQLNLDIDRIRNGAFDIPSIDGYGVIRLLPITEDCLKTISEKENEMEHLLKLGVKNQNLSQIEQNTGDISDPVSSIDVDLEPSGIGADYVIKTPIYTRGGAATSTMTTTATTFELKNFDGLNLPGVSNVVSEMFTKEYTIYPYIVNESSTKRVTAMQVLSPFNVYFSPNISIYSYITGTREIPFWKEKVSDNETCPVFQGYESLSVNGTFASLDETVNVNYVITDKLVLVKNGTLKIKIYSNRVKSQQTLVEYKNGLVNTEQKINVKYSPITVVSNGASETITPISEIDKWRSEVALNKNSTILQEDNVETNGQISIVKENLIKQGATIDDSESPVNIFYSNSREWIAATEFDPTIYEQTINIVNGKATLSIPKSSVESILFIEASYAFGDLNQFESIRCDLLFVANPVRIGYITPNLLVPGEDNKYEIGTNIIWMDGSFGDYIEDNTLVNFVGNSISPSVSYTDHGWAGGVFIGPHSPIVIDITQLEENACSPSNVPQTITIEVEHVSGYISKIERKIAWETEFTQSGLFYFQAYGDGNGWADGSISPYIISDLNQEPNCSTDDSGKWVWEDVCKRLNGYNQPLNQARQVSASISLETIASNIPVSLNKTRMPWTNGVVQFDFKGINANIGHAKTLCNEETFLDFPWELPVSLSTSCKMDNGSLLFGRGVDHFEINPETASEVAVKPSVKFIEPLGIVIETEEQFIRNGTDTIDIIADITWKGQRLPSPQEKIKINEGLSTQTEIEYPFPTVKFEAGVCSVPNVYTDDNGCSLCMDYRNLSSGCYTIANHDSVNLNTYTAQVGLYRTDKYTIGGNSHTHSCTVDINGTGKTETTIVLSGVVASHEHIITNYIALVESLGGHTHNLRSVAITTLQATNDESVDIAINGYVIYDPTNCIPYQNEAIKAEGNRMMFATIYFKGGTITTPQLKIDLFVAQHAWDNTGIRYGYTALNPSETSRGIDIRAHAYIDEYIKEEYEEWITIPARDVDDGTRIMFDVSTYKPAENNSSDVMSCSQQETKEYIILKITASVTFEGLSAVKTSWIKILSNLQWLPGITSLVTQPTNDSIYISNAIGQIDYLGASQIHDAVKMSAQRLIEFQTENEEYKEYKKAIVLLTDGDENTSQYSAEQAINNVSFIDGTKETSIYPIQLGYSYPSDELLLKSYADGTNGTMYYSIDLTSSQITDLVQTIISGENFFVNSGTYTYTIVSNDISLPISLSLSDLEMPVGSSVYFQWRTSLNSITWSDWTEWYDYATTASIIENIDNLQKYIQFRIKLYGNQDFESPIIKQGATFKYYSPQTLNIFFQPIDINVAEDDYLSSVHITHEADITTTSKISYGITQTSSTDISDYYSVVRPLIDSDKQSILLNRYNEILLTENHKFFTALNGGWEKNSSIEIYKTNITNPNGVLVDPKTYSANYVDGTITFGIIQSLEDSFLINIGFEPLFRIACKIQNYGSSGAILQYIALAYNIMKRIPKDNNGNIIHQSIGQRL